MDPKNGFWLPATVFLLRLSKSRSHHGKTRGAHFEGFFKLSLPGTLNNQFLMDGNGDFQPFF